MTFEAMFEVAVVWLFDLMESFIGIIIQVLEGIQERLAEISKSI